MPLSTTFADELLGLLFENLNIADIGDATGLRGSTTVGSVYVALHTADPAAAGTQATNECAYTGYARVAVPRTAAAWTRSGTSPVQIINDAIVQFAQCTGGSSTATHFSVGKLSSGAGVIMWRGPLNASLAVSNLIRPEFAIGQLVSTFLTV